MTPTEAHIYVLSYEEYSLGKTSIKSACMARLGYDITCHKVLF